VVGRLAGSHGGVPEVSVRWTVESEPIPATWIVCELDAVASADDAARIGRSWLGRCTGAVGCGEGVNADRLDSAVDIVDRPVSPGRGWNRGDTDGLPPPGRSAGRGCSGAKNSSSGSGGMPLAAASRAFRSAASSSSRRSRCLASTP
jgi:hypothetical protein